MNQSEKLDRFLAAIHAEGEAVRSRLNTEIAEQRAQVLTQAEHAALQTGYDYMHREIENIRTVQGSRISRIALDCRRTLFRQTEAFAAALFTQVEQDILAFTVTADYAAVLQKLWAEICTVLGGDVVLYLRPEDGALGETLFPTVRQEPGDFRLGGLIGHSGNRRADASYDTALGKAKRKFIEEVAP